MAFKQPRVPEYREHDGADGYIRSLVLFLKDFCMDVWTAKNQRTGEVDRLKGSIPEMPEAEDMDGALIDDENLPF